MTSGAEFVEVDIRRTPDGVIVLAHDEPTIGRRYPTYAELLENLPPEVGLHLDLKEMGFELELMRRAPDKVVVTPDFMESAETIKRHFPSVRVSPIDFVVLDQRYATDENLSRQTRPVWVWTVDDPRLMKRLIDNPHVEAIITNRPELAIEIRSARS